MKETNIKSGITTTYLIYMMTVFLWYTHYKYLDIMQAKRAAFLWGSTVYILAIAMITVTELFINKKLPWKLLRNTEHFVGGSICGLIVIGLVSTLGAINKVEAFWGYGAKCTGFYMYFCGLTIIICVGRYLEWNGLLTWILIISSTLVGIMQVINRWGIDPFNFYSDMNEAQIRFFIGPIGQVNYNASFSCMMAAILMCLFFTCRTTLSKIMFGVSLFWTYAGAICSCSDSAYVGLAFLFLVFMCYTASRPYYWRAICQMVIIFMLALGMIWVLYTFVKRVWLWDMTYVLMATLRLEALMLLAILFIVVGTIAYRRIGMDERKWKFFCIWSVILSVVALLAILVALFWNKDFWGSAIDWLVIRGNIWKRAFYVMGQSSAFRILFGYGYNNVSQALELYQLAEIDGTILVDMHNIGINMLLTSGILGTAMWLFFLLTVLKMALKKLQHNENNLFPLAFIGVYMVQGLFNGPQILTTPLFFAGLGVSVGILDLLKSPNVDIMYSK